MPRDDILTPDWKLLPFWWEEATPFRALADVPARSDLAIGSTTSALWRRASWRTVARRRVADHLRWARQVRRRGRADSRDHPAQLLCGVWPQLRGARISQARKGFDGFTFGFLPHMGEADDTHHSASCQGAGVGSIPYLGW